MSCCICSNSLKRKVVTSIYVSLPQVPPGLWWGKMCRRLTLMEFYEEAEYESRD